MSIIIHKTDPLSSTISVRDYTTNSLIHPLSSTLNTYAVEASTSLYLAGRGSTRYGEPLLENFVHLLEHHAGSTAPNNPISGQMWYFKNQFLRTSLGFYKWDEQLQVWVSFVETIAPYSFNGTDLFYTSPDTQHPLFGIPINCEFTTNLTISNPNSPQRIPNNIIRIFDGNDWKNINSISTGINEPLDPFEGMLWYDVSSQVLKIYTSNTWETVVNDYLPLTGGTISGNLTVLGTCNIGSNTTISGTLQSNGNFSVSNSVSVNMGNNIVQGVLNPLSGTDAANKNYVDAVVLSGTTSIDLDTLTDVIISSPLNNQILRYNNSLVTWENVNFNDLNVGINDIVNLNSELNNKFSLVTNNAVSGGLILDFGTNRLQNVGYPLASTDAATYQFVVDQIGSGFFPMSGGNLSGPIYASGSILSGGADNGVIDIGGMGINTIGTGNSMVFQHGSSSHPLTGLISSVSYMSISFEYPSFQAPKIQGYGSLSTGITISGYTDAPNNAPLSGVIRLNAAKENGSNNITSLSTSECILSVENNGTVVFAVSGNGDLSVSGTINGGSW